MELPKDAQLNKSVSSVLNQSLELKLFHYESIHQIEKKQWDLIFEDKGTFNWDGLKLLESVFMNNKIREDDWEFDYIIIKNFYGEIVVATFLTTALWKDDMLSPAAISSQVERARISDPYYLTNKVLCTGSLITEGEHLYINFTSQVWKDAVGLLLEKIYFIQENRKATHIVLRDFQLNNLEFDNLMVDNGYFKLKMPASHSLQLDNWSNADALYNLLSFNNKNHLRKKVLRNETKFKLEIIFVSGWQEEIDYWYELYRNVQSKNLELNTFPLSKEFFNQLAKNENWEILQITLADKSIDSDKPCCKKLLCADYYRD